MIRRILSGLVSGGVLGAVILLLASQFLPVTELESPTPVPGEAVVPAGSEFNAERPDDAPLLPQTEGRPGVVAAPEVSAPLATPAPALDTSPAGTPETGTPSEVLTSPATGTVPAVEPDSEDAVAAVPGTAQPSRPGVDATPTAAEPLNVPDTAPAPEPVLEAPASGEAPQMAPAAETSLDVAGVAAPPAQPAVDATPAADAPAAAPEAGDSPAEIAAPAPQPAADALPTPEDPVPEAGEGPADIAAPAPQPTADPPPARDAPAEADDVPADIAASEPQPAAPRILQPDAPIGFGAEAPEFGNLSPGIDTDRLPRIGAGPEAPAGLAMAEPALTRYGVPFDGGGGPLLSLVVIDGPAAPEPAGLADFPVPLTVAVDPNADGAGARMAAYRAAGLEVAVLTPLAEGATPADVEVSFQSFLTAVPQAAAVMDMPEALLQQSRPRAVQVVEILAETGHGMLTYDRGLNSGLQIAEGKGVAAASVFRVFDDGTKDGGAIKRYLDQGAFRAGQVGPVVLVGQMRAETIAAIAEWALSTRAATVSLAPLSAVLQAK